jgi:hypothetical protein
VTAGAAGPLLRQVPLRRRAGVDANVEVVRSKALDVSIDGCTRLSGAVARAACYSATAVHDVLHMAGVDD